MTLSSAGRFPSRASHPPTGPDGLIQRRRHSASLLAAHPGPQRLDPRRIPAYTAGTRGTAPAPPFPFYYDDAHTA